MISFQSFYAQDSVESIKAKISHKENNGYFFVENSAINNSEIHRVRILIP